MEQAEGSRGSQAYRALLEKLRSRTLAPGTRLREDEVATLLGVSRTPVREALARLQARGLVVASGGGLAVVQLGRAQVMELYAMRAILEGAAARFAAENASSDDLAALAHACVRFSELKGMAEEFAAANVAFHETIYEAGRNRYVVRMLQDLNDPLSLLPDTTFSVTGRIDAARREHEEIVAAIAGRDPDRAEACARAHIAKARDARLELLFAQR